MAITVSKYGTFDFQWRGGDLDLQDKEPRPRPGEPGSDTWPWCDTGGGESDPVEPEPKDPEPCPWCSENNN
jgi:hypothetical protein